MDDPLQWELDRGALPTARWYAQELEKRVRDMKDALELLATGEPAAAGDAKPLRYKEWVRMIARNAINEALGPPQDSGNR